MKDNWNSEDWQGRSKRQIENSYKTLDLIFKCMGLVGAVLLAIYLFF